MRIAYIDFRFPAGHKEQNSYYINALCKLGHDVTVYCPPNWYDQYYIDGRVKFCDIVYEDCFNQYKGFRNIVELVRREYEVLRKIKTEGYDRLFIASYENLSYLFFDMFVKKERKILLQHDNVDSLGSVFRRIAFYCYRKNNIYVVFKEYIGERLSCIARKKINVKVLHHQINRKEIGCFSRKGGHQIIALSNTNDEKCIKDIVDADKKGRLDRLSKNFLLKSKEIVYEGKKVQTIVGYLDKEEYERLFCECETVLIPFAESMKYRESGTIIDGLSNGKIIIGSDINIVNSYAEKYPEDVFVYKDIGDLINIIETIVPKDDVNAMFLQEHSLENVLEDLKDILNDE